VAQKLGVTSETPRRWPGQAQVDDGARTGTTSDESAELKRLRRENAELKRANEILKAASAIFAAELCATWRSLIEEVSDPNAWRRPAPPQDDVHVGTPRSAPDPGSDRSGSGGWRR
jgi:hypothetical protein